MAVQIARRQFNTSEYHRMAEAGILTEDDRVELVEGEIVEMTPIGMRHAACVDRLDRFLNRQADDRAIVRTQGPVRLSNVSEVQPDIALLRPRSDFYSSRLPTPSDVLLVVEVADTSVETDRSVKVPLYARSGIPVVWLVSLPEQTIEVYSNPVGGMYQDLAQAQQGGSVRLPGILAAEIAVGDILV